MINSRPKGYKTFFVLNSAEHEIYPANKSQITSNCNSFLLNLAKIKNFSAYTYENAKNILLHISYLFCLSF